MTIKSKQLKIAYFTDTFYPQINGIVSSVINLTTSLADKGHKIFIVAPEVDKDFEEFKYPGISVLRITSIKASFYEDFRWTKIMSLRTFKILKESEIDIIHFQTPVGLGIMAVNMSKLLNTPLVGTYHTFISDPRYIKHWKIFKPTLLIQNLSWIYTNQFYNRTDLTTAPSQSTILEMIENGCSAQNMKTISNGIDRQQFDRTKRDIVKKQYKLTDKTILYVGRVSHEKNIETLLEAFIYAAKRDNDIKLMIVGDGPQMETIKSLSSSSSFYDRIIITGSIEHRELVKSSIYNACEIFASASETENQPMTILEAQINGCICIGVNARGVPGMIRDGISGRIVEKGDSRAMGEAFIEILNDNVKLDSMKKATLLEVENHLLTHVVDRWESEYYELISKFTGRTLRDKLFYPLKKLESNLTNKQ